MKKLPLISLIVVVVALLIVGFATPIFAHGPDDGVAGPADEEAWEAMHEACESGDWEAMTEAAEEVHGDGFNMPWSGMWGNMGGGMMGW